MAGMAFVRELVSINVKKGELQRNRRKQADIWRYRREIIGGVLRGMVTRWHAFDKAAEKLPGSENRHAGRHGGILAGLGARLSLVAIMPRGAWLIE